MAETYGTLQHQFTVDSIPFSTDVPTRLNIKKRRERVVYRTLSNRDNINIAYLMGNETVPANNLLISDRSTSLVQNRIPSSQDITTETTASITLNVDKFLVTDVFTTETPTKPETPLFYVHTLENFNADVVDFSDKELLSIQFLDYNLVPINLSEYSLDSSTGELYNNIENIYDSGTGESDVTFIKYTIRTTSSGISTIDVYHELISNSPIFGLADFDDLDAWGVLLPTVKKYTIEELPGGDFFQVALPLTTQYAYKETPESRIRVLAPTAIDLSTFWSARITNGSFLTSLQTSLTGNTNHKYHVAEFETQGFWPFPPYKQQLTQRAVWLTKNLVKVAKNIANQEALGLYVEVIIKDKNRDLKYAYTTDSSVIGNTYQGTTNYTAGVLSVDELNGFIELLNDVRSDDIIEVSYTTEEDEYEFTSIDFNPANNLDILNKRIVIYVIPETSATGELDETVYYLVVDPLGKISYSSQADTGTATEPSTQRLLEEDFNAAGLPIHNFYYDITSTTSGLNSNVASGVNLGHVDDFSFVDKYTVESVLLTSSTLPSGYAYLNYTANDRFLVLADVYVGESQSHDGFSEFDVRVQGGGIKDEYRWDALKEQPQAAWYWDFSTNRPYPGAGAFMAELPQSLLEDYGGDFTYDQIKDIVERHMKIGGYAVVDTYGIDPVPTGCIVNSGLVELYWPSYGSNVTYNIYTSTDIDTGFTTANTTTISDVSIGNTYTVSGLTPSTKYYLYVGATGSDGYESAGTTISATTSGVGV